MTTASMPHAAVRASSVRWQVIALLMSFSFMTWFNRVSMSVAGVRIIHEGLLSPTSMGTVYSAFLFAYALCMVPGGWLTDRFGPRAALLFMGFGSGLFGALTGAVGLLPRGVWPLFTGLLVARALMGVFTAPIYPASGRLVSHWMPFAQRAWANGTVQGCAALGIACSYVVFGRLVGWFDWPMAFLVTGGFTAALAAWFGLVVTNRPAEHPRVNEAERRWIDGPLAGRTPTGRGGGGATGVAREHAEADAAEPPSRASWSTLLRHRSLILLTVSYACVGYFEYLLYFWVPYYFGDVLKMSTATSELASTLPPLAMSLGMPLGGWISDRLVHRGHYRLGRALVPAAAMIASAVFLLGGLCATWAALHPLWVVACFSLGLGAMGAAEGPVWTTAIEMGGGRGATAAAICNTGGNLGGMIAPALTPWVGTTYGWGYAMALSSVICLAGASLWLWIDPRPLQPESG